MVAAGRFKFSHRAMQARLLADLHSFPSEPLAPPAAPAAAAAPAAPAAAPPPAPPPTPAPPPAPPPYVLKAALLVNLYQDEPILNQAFRFLQKLMDIDELMTQWRHRHALMVRYL